MPDYSRAKHWPNTPIYRKRKDFLRSTGAQAIVQHRWKELKWSWHRNRQVNRWDRTEDPEIIPSINRWACMQLESF